LSRLARFTLWEFEVGAKPTRLLQILQVVPISKRHMGKNYVHILERTSHIGGCPDQKRSDERTSWLLQSAPCNTHARLNILFHNKSNQNAPRDRRHWILLFVNILFHFGIIACGLLLLFPLSCLSNVRLD
jgi:hypothetical protein